MLGDFQESEKLSDLDLLKSYAKQWDQYTTGAGYINKLFNYLNKHWVKREKDEGRKEVYTVYTVCSTSPVFAILISRHPARPGSLEAESISTITELRKGH